MLLALIAPGFRRRASPALAALALAPLVATLSAPPANAAFPGRDGKLVFSWYSFMESEFEPFPSRTENSIRTSMLGDDDATTLRGCTRETGKPDVGDCSIGYSRPAVSPNGRRIAFGTGTGLALMRIDGSGFRTIPSREVGDSDPAFSPGGRRLVFVAGPPRSARNPSVRGLRTSDLSGRSVHRVTGQGFAPSWSTRNWIAFLRADGVYRVRPDGRGLRRLVAIRGCTDVDWAPRGTRLAFTCLVRHRDRLYVARGDGSHRRRVVLPYESPESVAWSPSGRFLATGVFDGGISIHRLDGSPGPTVPGAGGGSGATYTLGGASPAWQPLPRR